MNSKNMFTLLLLVAAFTTNAQTILRTGEWCSHFNTNYRAPVVNNTDGRSDSIDIIHTHVDLNVTDFVNNRIKGAATLEFTPKIAAVNTLRFDLINLTVDSVQLPGLGMTWNYNGKHILVETTAPFALGNTYTIKIFYQGKPATDASGWGGFYFQAGFAYNLGVGFDADPHNYGRVWYPCFDNFVERSTFSAAVTTPADKPAFGNGLLQSDEVLPNNLRRRTWDISDPIPSYLTCVALGPFTSYERTVAGELGSIPVQIAVPPADTNKLKGSFLHLPEAVAAFEHWYGPYRWEKIGYSVVPFNAGAMEHATNIAYMRSAVNGNLDSETLMAHELSHHWWGDLATCSTAEDMWLNEGWASFSEHLFLEWVYGRERYIRAVEENFLDVVETTHISEGGYRAVTGIPHEITYGSHVYDKGAVVPHNLRAYLGDSLFRIGLRAVMEQTQMEDFSSAELRDKLTAATGVNMNDFFENWVFEPGFTDFTLDSTQFEPLANGNTKVSVWVKQRLRGTNKYYNNVPLELSFLRPGTTPLYRQGTVSGVQTKLEFEFPANANLSGKVWVNTRSTLTQARAVAEKNITNNIVSISFAPAKLDIKVSDPIVDTVKLRVEYHYANPDSAAPAGYQLTNRFWVVDGQIPDNANGTMVFTYDGRGQADQLDRLLFLATGPKEDSVRLLYRPHAGMPWQEHPAYTKNTLGSTTDRWGQLRTSRVLRGEYTIGKGASTVDVPEISALTDDLKMYPNPANHQCTVEMTHPIQRIQVYDASGKLALERTGIGQHIYNLDVRELPRGTYHLLVQDVDGNAGVWELIKI